MSDETRSGGGAQGSGDARQAGGQACGRASGQAGAASWAEAAAPAQSAGAPASAGSADSAQGADQAQGAGEPAGTGIAASLEAVRRRVRAAAERAGRRAGDITILAVSKTKPPSAIAEAHRLGVEDFAENRVQELLEKQASPECGGLGVRWHLVGHLQTNKARQVVGRTALIHSVDRMAVALELQKWAEKLGARADVLIQSNIAREASKFGFFPEDTAEAASEVAKLPNLRVRGLMTVAPLVEDPEENRQVFRELFKFYIDIKDKKMDNVDMRILSMGMSNDFEVAIEEGANMVRIGTLLFGRR
jgi:pyridoxal phosphate enzyme (YggS family)